MAIARKHRGVEAGADGSVVKARALRRRAEDDGDGELVASGERILIVTLRDLEDCVAGGVEAKGAATVAGTGDKRRLVVVRVPRAEGGVHELRRPVGVGRRRGGCRAGVGEVRGGRAARREQVAVGAGGGVVLAGKLVHHRTRLGLVERAALVEARLVDVAAEAAHLLASGAVHVRCTEVERILRVPVLETRVEVGDRFERAVGEAVVEVVDHFVAAHRHDCHGEVRLTFRAALVERGHQIRAAAESARVRGVVAQVKRRPIVVRVEQGDGIWPVCAPGAVVADDAAARVCAPALRGALRRGTEHHRKREVRFACKRVVGRMEAEDAAG